MWVCFSNGATLDFFAVSMDEDEKFLFDIAGYLQTKMTPMNWEFWAHWTIPRPRTNFNIKLQTIY